MIGDCNHSNFDESGVCTACREFYSAEHDAHPNDIHPAMQRLVQTFCEHDWFCSAAAATKECLKCGRVLRSQAEQDQLPGVE